MSIAEHSDLAVRSAVRDFITDNFLYIRPDVELRDDDDLLGLAVLDSLGFVELVEEVQARFGIEVRDVEITEQNFGCIDSIVSFVDRRRRELLR